MIPEVGMLTFVMRSSISHRSHPDEATDLDHIGKHRMLCPMEALHPSIVRRLGSIPFDMGTHTYQ